MDIVKTKKKTEQGVLYKRTCAYCGETVQYYHAAKPEYCPYCGSYNYIKPPTETKLFLLQKQYFEHGRDKNILGKMYLLLRDYAESMIKTQLKNNQMTRYTYDDIDMKASDAATLLLEYYLTKPGFKIEQSFGGYLENKVKEALYNKKNQKEEVHSSYNSLLVDSEGHTEEIGELKEKLNIHYIFGNEEEYQRRVLSEKELLQGIQKIISTIVETVSKNYDKKDSLSLILGIYIRLRQNNTNMMDLFYKQFGSEYKNFIDQSLLFLYDFIKESQNYQQRNY